MPISTPTKITVPWATSGLKNAIPAAANNITGTAGYDAGFPAITMTPKVAGGIPPQGQDFNGAFFDVTTALQFLEAGGSFPFDGAFATAVGGYPLGALVSKTDSTGLWRNTVANNAVDPESSGVTGWIPEDAGGTGISMASANITLTNLQASKTIIIIVGALTANLQLIFPPFVKQWLVINNATGAFTVTCKTSAGSGVAVPTSSVRPIYCDGGSIFTSSGLGTAATSDVVTSPVDTTVGRVLTVGYEGLGAQITPLNSTVNLTVSGFGRWDTSTAFFGNYGANSGNTISVGGGVPGDLASQIYIGRITDNLIGFRSGAGPFREIWHTGNNNITGAVIAFAMSAAPAGFLKANGVAVSRTTYAALFATIGTQFGVGDGSTTFNLPDLRAEFIRGWDDTRGIDPARAFGSFQAQDYQAHTHNIKGTVEVPAGGSNSINGLLHGANTYNQATDSSGNTETRPRNVALLYCIKT